MELRKIRSIVSLSLVVLAWGLVLLTADMAPAQQDRRIIRQKERRVALVIGNGAYKSSPLGNPVNDANDMAAALKRCNFTVMKATNADRKSMRRAIRNFGDEISRGAVGLFFYAGHGIQVKGENYLVPVGADVHREAEVEDECLKVSSVLRQMENAGNRLNIIILDACRDNPFKRSFRSSNQGLAKMDAPTGSILAYATAPGSVAADGTTRNGLYTSKILKYIMTPGLKIEDLFKQVRVAVVNTTGKRQVPWESSSLMGDFYFVEGKDTSVAKPPRPTEERPPQQVASLPPKPSVSKPKVIARDGNFEKYANGVVKDTRTGLEWVVGPERNTNWDDARTWVQSLSIAGGGWRMPTVDELKALYKKGKGSRNMTPLLKTIGWWVWSGETKGSWSAWYFDFLNGYRNGDKRAGSGSRRAFAVRSR